MTSRSIQVRVSTGFFAVLGLALLSMSPTAQAQSSSRNPALGRSLDVSALVGDRLAQEAIYSLSGQTQPREDQLTRAAILMDLALDQISDDAELWRLRGELAGRRDHQDKQHQALRKYLRLRPQDDAAQFRLVQSRMDQIDTLDQRLAAIENVLHSAHQHWSKPLQSRLSSYAAAAAKEMGDTKRFTKHLKKALNFDPANEQAAAMAVDYVRSQNGSVRQLATVTVNLIRALPTDASARLGLAELLIGESAFQRGAQQYRIAWRLAPSMMRPQAYRSWVLALGSSAQSDEAIQLLDDLETRLNRQAQAAANRAQPQNQQTAGPGRAGPSGQGSNNSAQPNQAGSSNAQGGASQPQGQSNPDQKTEKAGGQTVSLPLDLELMRLAILTNRDNADRVNAVFHRIENRLRQGGKSATRDAPEAEDAPGTGDEQAGPDQPNAEPDSDQNGNATKPAANPSTNAKLDLAWLAALFNRNNPSTTKLLQGIDSDDPRISLARGWLAVHADRPDEAKRLLQPLSDTEPLASLGLAVVDSAKGGSKAQALTNVIHDHPRTLAAMLAAQRLEKLGQSVSPTSEGHALVALMNRRSAKLWKMKPNELSWIHLNLQIQPVRFAFAEPIEGKLTIRSSAPMPLSLGTGRAVPSRTMLIASPTVSGKPVSRPVRLVVDAARRLTLGPGESVTVPIRMKRSNLGRIIDIHRFHTVTFSTRGVLNPQFSRRGRINPGLLGSRDRVSVKQVRGLPPTKRNIDQWLSQLDSNDALTRMQALGRLAQLTPSIVGPKLDQQQLQRVADALNDRFQDMSAESQAWTLLFLQTAQQGPGGGPANSQYQPLLNAAQQSDSTLVRIAYLHSQVSDPNAQAINTALGESNREIRSFGSALKTAITKQQAQSHSQPKNAPQK